MELSNVEGKNRIGSAIPLIIPNWERAFELSRANLARFFGTSMFSTVRSAVFKYLPEVIGTEISSIFAVNLYGGFCLPFRLLSRFLLNL